MMYLYFFLISYALMGYGFIASKFLKINNLNFGILGLLGITFFTLISYFSSIFIKHDFFFNFTILSFGLFFFILNLKKIFFIKNEILIHSTIFIILFFFISIAKNHDDFAYYHFPYMHMLNEFSHPIGIGLLNNGFRSPSSIFFISSMFYLPKIEFYLFHLTPAFILGFSNILLLKEILNKDNFYNDKFFCFLNLIIFCFVNIFFYRLAEHGTDRSGMIIVMIAITYLIYLLIIKENTNKSIYLEKLKFFIIFICFIFSIKPFYIIVSPILLLLLINSHSRREVLNLIFSKTSLYGLTFIFFTVFYTFINSSCLIFPISFTCFENLSWSIPKSHVEDVKVWFELWSKGGATPTGVVDNRENYIEGLNWFSNWIDVYFFNKVIDFILGILLLCLIIFLFFFKFNNKIEKKKFKYNAIYLVYFCLVLIFLEWFFFHPTLRYGGYYVIALIFFIPLSLYLSKKSLDYKDYFFRCITLIIVTFFIFLARNVGRINAENEKYSYHPLKNSNYQFIGGSRSDYLRYNLKIKQEVNYYKKINIFGKELIITNLRK